MQNENKDELDDLLYAKYIPAFEEDQIETARDDTGIRGSGHPVDAGDMAFMKPDMYEATPLLEKLKNADKEMLNNSAHWIQAYPESLKWSRSNRLNELDLIHYAIVNIDKRPKQLHFSCRRLTETDVASTVHKCLSAYIPQNNRSLLRITIKTEMPFKQFLGQITQLQQKNKNIEVQEGMVTATILLEDGYHKMISPEFDKYADLEHILSDINTHNMSSMARFKLSVKDRQHVHVNIVFSNNLVKHRRIKTIDIEQEIRPTRNWSRRVTFAPASMNEIVEYEIPDSAPFISLARSRKQIFNLNEYLNDVRDAISQKAQQ